MFGKDITEWNVGKDIFLLWLHVFLRQLAHVVSGPLIPSNKKKEDLAHSDLAHKESKRKKRDLAHSDLAHYILYIYVSKQEKKKTPAPLPNIEQSNLAHFQA